MTFSSSAQAYVEQRIADVRRREQLAAWHADNARALASMAVPEPRAERPRRRPHEEAEVRRGTEADPVTAEGVASTTAARVLRALDHTRTHFVVLAPDGTTAFANRAHVEWIRGVDDGGGGQGRTYADTLAALAAAVPGNDRSGGPSASIRDVVTGALPSYVEEVAHTPGDRTYVHRVSAQNLPEGGAVITHWEVTDYVLTRQELERRARQDSLTDVLNQGTFRDAGTRMVDAMVRDGRSSAVLLVDIDDFKTVNDTFGHASGDAVLVAVAKRMQHSLRAGDLVGRLGGDEFGIVLGDVADTDAFMARLERTLSAPVSSQGTVVRVRSSIGMARAPHDGTTFETLMHLADERMFRRKREDRRGRNGRGTDGAA